jgi:hypothetical protein
MGHGSIWHDRVPSMPSPELRPEEIIEDATGGGLEVLRRVREVGLATVIRRGQQRIYRLKSLELKPVHDWVSKFEQVWARQLDRIKERAERKASGQSESQPRQSD